MRFDGVDGKLKLSRNLGIGFALTDEIHYFFFAVSKFVHSKGNYTLRQI